MTIRAIAGVIGLNVAAFAVGIAILWAGRAYTWWVDVVRLAGVAHLVGLAALMTVLSILMLAGVPVTMTAVVVTLVALAAAAVAIGARQAALPDGFTPPGWRFPLVSPFVAVLLAGLVVYLEGLFRQARLSSTLVEFDGWWNWIPKAKAIYHFGELDPEFLAFLPNQSYPPGLPTLHAAAFHFMGGADDVTLHLQYWFYAAGFVAALAGLLSTRVAPTIFVPLLFLVLLAPSFVIRFTWTYADVPLGFLVATAALVLVLWLEERQPWQLATAVILLSGTTLVKREGLLLAGCVLAAAFVASVANRRASWPRLLAAGVIVLCVSIPWRIWFASRGDLGITGDAPSAGAVGGLDDLDRGWATVKLVVSTLFETDFWLVAPSVAVAAIALGLLARAWLLSVYTCAFVLLAGAAGTWAIWSERGFPITTDDSLNPIVRLTGTTILVLAALTPLLLERAWSASTAGRSAAVTSAWAQANGPDALVWRSRAAWSVVVAAALAYPASMLVGYSGLTLPGGRPNFPSSSDCVTSPVPGEPVRLVVGYTESYADAGALRRRATAAGLPTPRVAQDGCGRLRVSIDDLPSATATPQLARARDADLRATLEADERN